MEAQDENTGAVTNAWGSAYGSTAFVGSPPDTNYNNYGQFSGPMTEEINLQLNGHEGNGNPVKYVPLTSDLKNIPVWLEVEDTYENIGVGGNEGKSAIYDLFTQFFPILPTPAYILAQEPDGKSAGEEYFSNGTLITGISEGPPSTNIQTPYAVVFDPAGLYAYIDYQGSDNIAVEDAVSLTDGLPTLVATIKLPETPYGMAISPDGSMLYVSVPGAIDVISTVSRKVVKSIPIPNPYPILGLVISPSGSALYGTGGGYLVEEINLKTDTIVGGLQVQPPGFDDPNGAIAINPSGTTLYLPGVDDSQDTGDVSSYSMPGLAIIDAGSLTITGEVTGQVVNCVTSAGGSLDDPDQGPITSCYGGGQGEGVAVAPNGQVYWNYCPAYAGIGTSPNCVIADLSGSTVGSITNSEFLNIAIGPNNIPYAVACSDIAYSGEDIGFTGVYQLGVGISRSLTTCPSFYNGVNLGGEINPQTLAFDPNPNIPIGIVLTQSGYNVFSTK
jgi:DNA-binding beta-propeller fold protein YncE